VRDPKILLVLEGLIEPGTRGDPESPFRWICKSTRTRKMEEGEDHPDRAAQFRDINVEVKRVLAKDMPVISVDTKKKGNCSGL